MNDSYDRGGATNYGITQSTYSQWLGRRASVAEIRAMNVDTAKEIYLNYYYKPRINGLPVPTQPQIFYCAINHGSRRAIKFVQTVCNLAGFGPVEIDGVNGPLTMGAVDIAFEIMGNYFINAIADERISFFNAIIKKDSSQERFIDGWLKRAETYRLPLGL